MTHNSTGPLVLLGGEGLGADSAALWQRIAELAPAQPCRALILPAALAGHKLGMPERRATLAQQALASFGLQADVLPVLTRERADDSLVCAQVKSGACIYLTGGEPRVLRDVLHDTALWRTITAHHAAGAPLIAAGGAVAALGSCGFAAHGPTPPALGDQTLERFDGLGLLPETAILPYADWLSPELVARIRMLCLPGTLLVAIDHTAALVHTSEGWQVEGSSTVTFWRGGDLLYTAAAGQPIPPGLLVRG